LPATTCGWELANFANKTWHLQVAGVTGIMPTHHGGTGT